MKFLVVLWVMVEVLQIVVIGMLAVGYRNLQRRLDVERGFAARAPRSVVDE